MAGRAWSRRNQGEQIQPFHLPAIEPQARIDAPLQRLEMQPMTAGEMALAADATTRTIRYAYDALNRLTAAGYDDGMAFNYSYDAACAS